MESQHLTSQRHFLFPKERIKTFESFQSFSKNQHALLTLIKNQLTEGASLILQGPRASGKTHLIQAASRFSVPSMYLDHATCAKLCPNILLGLSHTRLCIDDLPRLLQTPEWEHALFSFLSGHNNTLITSLQQRSQIEAVGLPDLRSRLFSYLCLSTEPLNQHEQSQVLQAKALKRGLALKQEHVAWLMRHQPRDNHFLFHFLEVLEAACIRYQLPPSIYLIKNNLKSL